MQKILVSACLLGEKVRYNGTDKLVSHPVIAKWQEQKRLVLICPEVSGGLPVPRPPAEIQNDGLIFTSTGEDVTQAFQRGAKHALELCQQHSIEYALLKARSPSCGNTEIYDGSFNSKTIPGSGVTAKLLIEHGIQVFNETQIDVLANLLEY
jgi:uncharacterized protein YbbK (DUF523 family)